jgi:hypothetical protein
MESFQDFIRYGLPGYIFIGSILFCLFITGGLPQEKAFYDTFATIAGTIGLVIGPLIGFIIHQIYLTYFDWKESYTKLTRKCINVIYQSYLLSDFFKTKLADRSLVQRLASTTWIVLTTNFEDDFKVDSLYIERLRSLRNFSHSFGAIVTSCFLSFVVTLTILLCSHLAGFLSVLVLWIALLGLALLFYLKRKELMARIDDFEVNIVLLRKSRFVEYLHDLLNVTLENKNILS